MKARNKRIILALIGLTAVGMAAYLAISALRNNIAYFFSPSQVLANEAPIGATFRLGGLVEKGSLRRHNDSLKVEFFVTDLAQKVPVVYTGILPDLFKEGQGVVTKGRLGTDGRFYADSVLAKHDETYMPPEVAASLKTTHKLKDTRK
ncbi:cytochrome C biogenesis protein CcmE [Achromatium sp. WMS3]|nr:cytochrome C biogenesis protein CcmE [Achromatium sp. WMS3]